MLNQVVLVGRIVDNPEIKKSENGKKETCVVVAVQRPFKNTDGIYENNFIKCNLWNNIALNTVEYCKKGDVVGIKGYIQRNNYENEDGTKKYRTEVIVERITFLSNKGKEE